MHTYQDADGYDLYMGEWSAMLAPLFLDFADAGAPGAVLDVGCGTGNLLAAARARWPTARLSGVDPSVALIGKASQRPELNGVEMRQGTAEHLPFANGSLDATLSMLVLQEFPDRLAALTDMRRVTRQGGVVAACQWDFARMPVIHTLIESIVAVAPDAGARINGSAPRAFADESELAQWWEKAGLTEVTTSRVSVTRAFCCFDDIWLPLLRGATPSTLTLASLPQAQQAAVGELMRSRLGGDSGAQISAQAMVVRGLV